MAAALSERRQYRPAGSFLATSPLATPDSPPAQCAVVLSLRTEHFLPAFQIARSTGLSKATVSRLLRRHCLHRLRTLTPPPPVVRYQREHPGELIHFDIKKLGRFSRPGARMTGNPHDYTPKAGYDN